MSLAFSVFSLDSPIGPLAFACDADGAVRGASFAGETGDGLKRSMTREYRGATLTDGQPPEAVLAPLRAYLGGDGDALTRIPWRIEGDGFQQRVWRALAEIPSGVTITYSEIARRAGEPGAAQAAGVALNRNPIALVLPCHRVIGADGALVGFGGGLERKRWLLQHEGAILL